VGSDETAPAAQAVVVERLPGGLSQQNLAHELLPAELHRTAALQDQLAPTSFLQNGSISNATAPHGTVAAKQPSQKETTLETTKLENLWVNTSPQQVANFLCFNTAEKDCEHKKHTKNAPLEHSQVPPALRSCNPFCKGNE